MATMPPLPDRCECDVFMHEHAPCQNSPADNGTVRSSPALCPRCLFYCYNDDDGF